MKMDAVTASELLVTSYQSTWLHTPEDCDFHGHRRDNLKSRPSYEVGTLNTQTQLAGFTVKTQNTSQVVTEQPVNSSVESQPTFRKKALLAACFMLVS
jgi:hypothetical protein